MEIEADASTIAAYLSQYQGLTRYQRLLTLADKQPKFKVQALKLCLELAQAEKKLNYYYEVVKILKRQYHDSPDECPLPNFGTDQQFERTVSQEYKNEVKRKEQEIQQLQKSLLRDSMRIAFNELGQIHYNYGFVNDAIKSWVKSHDFSTDQEDLFQMAFQIAKASYESTTQSYLVKYSGEAEARDKGKNQSVTMQIKVLDAMSALFQDRFSVASHRLVGITVTDPQTLTQYLSPQDLAYYIVLTSLHSLNRAELKKSILGASNFKNLMEAAPEASEIIENFLNGKYQEFQQSLSHIVHALRFDIYFGHRIHQIVNEIRKKALIQYVTPYKVIDMREIAKAFDLSIEQIEAEIAELIVAKKIQAKIDSHSKLLYSRKDNETLNSYKEAVTFGRIFIQETENALLRVQAMQKNKFLKPVNMLTQTMSGGSRREGGIRESTSHHSSSNMQESPMNDTQ